MTCRKKKGGTFTNAIACLLGLIVAIAAHAQPIVDLRVDGDNGDVPPPLGNADGSDWGPLAFKYLQDALAEAQDLVQFGFVVRLWVAETDPSNPYRPDQCATCGPDGVPGASEDPVATFNLINNVELYGGFSGDERVLSQRNPEANETVLSGFIFQPEEGAIRRAMGTPAA